MTFLNPYHFVPVVSNLRKNDMTRGALAGEDAESPVTHAEYVAGAYSGRLLCRLTTDTPCFVGADRTEPGRKTPATVSNYRLDEHLGLPASSLRGMVSSLAEAASNSALRVLESNSYSFRRAMDPTQVLSAIGMVRVQAKDADGKYLPERKYFLMPLAMPTLPVDSHGLAELPAEYRPLFPQPQLKVYVGNARGIRAESFPYRTFRGDQPKYYYMKLQSRQWSSGYRLPDDQFQNRKPASRRFLISQFALDGGDPTDKLNPKEAGAFTPGIMRVLGCWGDRARGNMIPNNKKHEIFLPWPQYERWPLWPVGKAVVEGFHNLCDERTEASKNDDVRLPLEPLATPRNANPNDSSLPDPKSFRLKDGDLVYFKAALNERRQSYVSELSLSSIWRGEVVTLDGRSASAWDFFRAVDAELLPSHSKRTVVTLAEQMFGFVDDEEERDRRARVTAIEPGKNTGLALASRIRFSAATMETDETDALLPPQTLQILSSPKPPSPAMYFKNGGGRPGPIKKRELLPGHRTGEHVPQGRKMYLHHPDCAGVSEDGPWQTRRDENANQKCIVTLLRSGLDFYFHVDFDNLSDDEMALLVFALRPSDEFRHKLGMAKALGLGTVRTDVVAFLEIDRQARYTFEGLFAPRYARAHVVDKEMARELPAKMRSDVDGAAVRIAGDAVRRWREQHRGWMRQNIPDVLQAMLLIGDPGNVKLGVHTPTVDGRPDERETFAWFVENERTAQPQYLDPLNRNSKGLPALQPFTQVPAR